MFGPVDEERYLPGHRDDMSLVFLIVGIGVGVAAIASFLFVKPTPPPPAREFRGCYTSILAPSLFFDGRAVHFGQANMPPTPYRLELAKYGTIDIVTDAPMSLEPFGKRYLYDRGTQRTIVFGSLRHLVDGKAYGVLKVDDAQFIEAMTPDVMNVRYDPAPASDCQGRQGA